MFGILSRLSKDNSDNGPCEDQHQDENACVGDTRIYVRPSGEIWGYDKDVAKGKFRVSRQNYQENATFQNGKKSYAWREGRTIFRGSPSEWNSVKNNPENHFTDIPVIWDDIVEHVDNFLEIHSEYLDCEEYPHGVLKTD